MVLFASLLTCYNAISIRMLLRSGLASVAARKIRTLYWEHSKKVSPGRGRNGRALVKPASSLDHSYRNRYEWKSKQGS